MSTARPEVLPTLTEVIDLDLPRPAAQAPLPLAPESVPMEAVDEAQRWEARPLAATPSAQAATTMVVNAVVQSLAPRLQSWVESQMGATLEAQLRQALESALNPALEAALRTAREQLHAELPDLVRAALEQARRETPPR